MHGPRAQERPEQRGQAPEPVLAGGDEARHHRVVLERLGEDLRDGGQVGPVGLLDAHHGSSSVGVGTTPYDK
ncbi:hypothetical protein [Cellulomonas soli]